MKYTAVTEKTNITETVTYIPLNEQPSVWAEKILSFSPLENREGYADKVGKKGFGIESKVKRIDEILSEK